MKKRIWPSLSLSQKILTILACYIFGILAIFVVSQEDLSTAKEKLEVVELAYSLNSIILEVRRYEKNFLLYGTEDALKENTRQLQLALETMETISDRVVRFKAHPILESLKSVTLVYQADMGLLAEQYKLKNQNKESVPPFAVGSHDVGDGSQVLNNALVDKLRAQGQDMTELSKDLVNLEHTQIRTILDELAKQLVAWSCVAVTVGIFMPLIMFFRIFRPLRIINEATQDIAIGRFSKIEVLNTRDEMQQVMEAFNIMVRELGRRQDQLVQSQKLSSIGTLTAGIAHQLNNPLNNISTSCQIAMDDFDTGEPDFIKQMLKNIEQETYRARDVVQGLLEFSRVKEFARRPANLRDVVNRSVKLVKSQVPSAIEMSVDIPEDLLLPMDVQRMQEVLLNMIINASQAIRGEGNITISAHIHEASSKAVIEITDTGIGVEDEIKDRLFDPFYTTKEEGHGTGLGLSIAYGIIRKHDGEITVESSPGKGATFRIHLPLEQGEAES